MALKFGIRSFRACC